jgi:hypothetical protein
VTRLSILLLADDQKGHANTVHDHIQAFERYSRHHVRLFNPRGLARSRFLDLSGFDAVVLHYSIAVLWDDYLGPWFRERIADYDGLKVQFIQDEYRWVDDVAARVRELGIDVLYSVVPTAQVDAVYGGRLPDTEILYTLTGYVPEGLQGRRVPPTAGRPIDVGYRGRSVPYWLGRLGYEKVEIGRRFRALAPRLGLNVDIEWTEQARIYGERWNDFVSSCKAVLTSESGASLVDFDGSIERAVNDYIASRPAAAYEDVEAEVLSRFPGRPTINTSSPRIFEGAALRAALVMFPGEYSGVVRPWEHYIPLEKDFSNVEEVAERIRDVPFLEELTARTHADLIGSGEYSYERFVRQFDDEVAERSAAPRERRPYPAARLRLEQLSSGRSYRISALYWLARAAILRYLGLRHSLERAPLRRLALHLRADASREDLLRLAVLTGVQEGRIVPATEPFRIEARLDAELGRLTLTSRLPDEEAANGNGALHDDLARMLRSGDLSEIVWNHAGVGQYVGLRLRPTRKRIAFDVGRYDTYGVYRFDELVRVAKRDPELVLQALEPLLRPSPYRSAP